MKRGNATSLQLWRSLHRRKNFAFSASCRLFREHLPADCGGRGGLGTQPDLHRETKAPKASQVMVSTTFPPSLFGCVFGAMKWHTSFQHAVKDDQHMMSHRDNRALLATPWCQSLKAGPKDRVALTSCRPCTLHQNRTGLRARDSKRVSR